MPDRRWTLAASLLVLVLPSLALAATQQALDASKLRAHKQRDHAGYAPQVLLKGGGESEPNDLPEEADALVMAEPTWADLTPGDVDWFVLPCTGEGYLTFSTSSRDESAVDTIVRVFDANLSLVAEDDDGGLGLFSAAQHVPCSGDLYVQVSTFGGLGEGAYWIAVEAGTPPPPVPANDTPETYVDIECNGQWPGTTLGSTDTIDFMACIDYEPVGGEVFYRITVPYSYQLNLQVVPQTPFDPALYLFTDPAQPQASCVAGADEAFFDEPEVLSYVMDEDPQQRPVTYYIGVDSWSIYSTGDFTLIASCEFVVANEAPTWGAVKSRY